MRKDRIEKGGIADGTGNQLVDLLRRPGTDKEDIDPQKDEKEDWRDEKKGLDLQGMRSFQKGFNESNYRG